MTPPRFGLLGHGVVGSLLARLLREHGAEVTSYDVLLERKDDGEPMRRRIQADGARPASLEETIRASEYRACGSDYAGMPGCRGSGEPVSPRRTALLRFRFDLAER